MLSFFADAPTSKKTSGPAITRVTVKKPITKSLDPRAGSTARPSASSSSARPSTHSSSTPSLKLPPSSSSKSSSSVPKLSSASLKSPAHLSPRPQSTSSSPQSKSKKRAPSADSDSSSSDDAFSVKKPRTRIGSSILPEEEGLDREVFCLDKVDARGEWDRGWVGFVSSEEVMSDGKEREKYEAYFPQEGFAKGDWPGVELLYPAVGCRERFILLKPSSPREYSPISELIRAIDTIVKHYIPPSHTHLFGPLPSTSLSLDTAVPSRLSSPLPSFSVATPPLDSSIQVAMEDPIVRSLHKALNRRDGPGFVKAVTRFNSALEMLQRENKLKGEKKMSLKEWSELVDTVNDQTYGRIVGPQSNALEHPVITEEIARSIVEKESAYGELRHNFMSKIMELTQLGPESVFVDLGSGVGNCVLQAALQAGCRSYGFEFLPVPAKCARLQLAETRRRWAMWGLKGNLEMQAHEGDFRTHPDVAKRLREADVVLVNNEVFPSSLNQDLSQLFLDLKDGARIVSLKPFVPDGFRMNDSNV
ncbi:[histone H3]-lysine79 N-trimethyltransferase, partial [Tremellales sp. Uapishka_1]